MDKDKRGVTEEEKAALVRQMGSRVNEEAVRAAEALRAQGWLLGDSFEGIDLSGANLRGGTLCNVNLRGVNLTGANLGGMDLSGSNGQIN
jgi:uncharacterized protein YjbI with pentapeptide repeats